MTHPRDRVSKRDYSMPKSVGGPEQEIVGNISLTAFREDVSFVVYWNLLKIGSKGCAHFLRHLRP